MGRILDIAIAGAGISGLAAAIALRQAGHRVTVYERYEASRPIGSGLMIQPVGLAALDRLGLRDQIEQRGARIVGIAGKTGRGTTVFDLTYTELEPSLYAIAVHRAALHGVLWDGFARSGAVFQNSRELTNVSFNTDGRASFIDQSGSALPAADLLIDATGARSSLRYLVSPVRPHDFAYGAVWAAIPDPGIVADRLEQRYIAARVMLGLLPLGAIEPGGARLAALFWSLKPGDRPAWVAGFDAWRDAAAALWPALAPALTALHGPDDFTLAAYRHVTVPRPHRGALALIGDSAHCTSPQLGQGANHGLLDAVVLADAVAQTDNVQTALRLYARERRRQVRFYQFASRAMTPCFQSDSRLMPALRDLAFHRMKIVPYLKREMVRTLAGLKTGLFTSGTPEAIARLSARSRRAA